MESLDDCLARTKESVSWLRLELYALNEQSGAERERTENHLAQCQACAVRLQQIRSHDVSLLSLAASRPPSVWRRLRAAARIPRPMAWGALAATSVAISVMFIVSPAGEEHVLSGVKGSSTSITILRERAGVVSDAASAFAAGDRFKIAVSCVAAEGVYWDVVVMQAEQRFFPLAGGHVGCGNRVSLPGAFAVDGLEPILICTAVDIRTPPDRLALTSASIDELQQHHSCTALQPVGAQP